MTLPCISRPYPDSGLTGLANSLQLPFLYPSLHRSLYVHISPSLLPPPLHISLATLVRAGYPTSNGLIQREFLILNQNVATFKMRPKEHLRYSTVEEHSGVWIKSLH